MKSIAKLLYKVKILHYSMLHYWLLLPAYGTVSPRAFCIHVGRGYVLCFCNIPPYHSLAWPLLTFLNMPFNRLLIDVIYFLGYTLVPINKPITVPPLKSWFQALPLWTLYPTFLGPALQYCLVPEEPSVHGLYACPLRSSGLDSWLLIQTHILIWVAPSYLLQFHCILLPKPQPSAYPGSIYPSS